MNTQELRNKIDSILGNSMRVLLPSYWWKKLFHAVVDDIDDVRSTANSKANKSEVASLSNSVDALSDKVDKIDSGNNITVDSELSLGSTNPVQNKVVTEAIKELQNLPVSSGILITDETTAMKYLEVMLVAPEANANIAGYILHTEHSDSGNMVRYSLGVVDAVDIDGNKRTASLEYNIHGKRYRNIYNSANGALVETVELSSGGLPIYLCFDYGVGMISPPDREREANKAAYNALQNFGSSVPPYCILTIYKNGAKVGELSIGIEHYSTGTTLVFYTSDWDNGNKFELLKYRLHEDGSVTYEGLVQADSELSDTSTSPVQNKVVKAYVDTEVAKKVDKVSGKGLSTEDFTTVLKTKLEGLKNYDDTTLTNAISSLEKRLNTLVSGDASTAIESFNEIMAFLDGIKDTQDLASIIASIEQQIAAKQDKITDLQTIREGAAKGATALQKHQNISHLATKEELNDLAEEVITNEDIASAAFSELSSRIDSQVASLKRTTSQNLISQVENLRSSLTEIIIDDEDVVAAALAEQSQRIDSKTDRLERVKATRNELAVQVESILSTILENEDIISAALAEINGRIEHIEEVLKKK